MTDEAVIVYVDPDLEELIPGFMDNRRSDIKMIGELLADEEFDEIKRVGHSMKGSGGGYGFNEITQIGKVIEEAAQVHDYSAIQRMNRYLTKYLEKVQIVWQEEA